MLATPIAPDFRIDLKTQEVFPLSEASKHAPKRRGKEQHVSMFYRAAKNGCRRKSDGRTIKLPTIVVSHSLFTSAEALQWFAETLSAGPDDPESPGEHRPEPVHQTSRSQAARRASHEAAERELTRRGL